MKTRVKTAAVLTALIAGSLAIEARPKQAKQGQRFRREECSRPCPCHHERNRPRQGQYQQPRQQRLTPEQCERMERQWRNQRQISARQRERALQRFDRDGDGRLSERERAAARKAWRKQMEGAPGAPKRKNAATPDEE